MAQTPRRSSVDQSPVWLALRRSDHPAILISDRDNDVRETYAKHLAGLDCDVFVARDHEDLVRKAADLWPHVIVMELGTNDANGCQAIARLRRSTWTSGIRVIAVSDDPAVRELAFEKGCDAFLAKPFTPPVLRAQIRALIEPPESRSIRRDVPHLPIRPAA